MIKSKVISDISNFWAQFFLFSFISELKTDASWWQKRWKGGGVGHIAAGIILSTSYLLGFDLCSVLCLKLKVEVFIVSVHGLEFKRSECTSYYNIACQIQKDLY